MELQNLWCPMKQGSGIWRKLILKWELWRASLEFTIKCWTFSDRDILNPNISPPLCSEVLQKFWLGNLEIRPTSCTKITTVSLPPYVYLSPPSLLCLPPLSPFRPSLFLHLSNSPFIPPSFPHSIPSRPLFIFSMFLLSAPFSSSLPFSSSQSSFFLFLISLSFPLPLYS